MFTMTEQAVLTTAQQEVQKIEERLMVYHRMANCLRRLLVIGGLLGIYFVRIPAAGIQLL